MSERSESKDLDRFLHAAKGIAQASQESVDELNGRMTAMQEHTYSLMENTKILVDNSASMLERLCSIDINTAQLSKDIHSMNAQLNNMAIQGVESRYKLFSTNRVGKSPKS